MVFCFVKSKEPDISEQAVESTIYIAAIIRLLKFLIRRMFSLVD